MKYLVITAVALALIGCAGAKKATETKEATYQSTRRLDSLFRSELRHDSVYLHDSIYIYIKGDTVTKYVEKLRYRYLRYTDTIYRDCLKADTFYIDRVNRVVVERQIEWYNRGFMWLGKICCLAAILWLLFLYLKRKL